jgi:hypothetical protein
MAAVAVLIGAMASGAAAQTFVITQSSVTGSGLAVASAPQGQSTPLTFVDAHDGNGTFSGEAVAEGFDANNNRLSQGIVGGSGRANTSFGLQASAQIAATALSRRVAGITGSANASGTCITHVVFHATQNAVLGITAQWSANGAIVAPVSALAPASAGLQFSLSAPGESYQASAVWHSGDSTSSHNLVDPGYRVRVAAGADVSIDITCDATASATQGVQSPGATITCGVIIQAYSSACPTVSIPAWPATCVGGNASLTATPAGTGPFTYRWQIEGSPGAWTNLTNGPRPGLGVMSGATSATLDISGLASGVANFRCMVTNACGSATSNAAMLTICVADMDDGSATGACDAGVGIEDLLYYLGVYDAGTSRADVDDGTGTGTPDGGVGIEDLLYYLQRYDAGC